MFVSDAHLFVPREVRWKRILAIRWTGSRRRKSLMRRIRRDARMLLPIAALVFTFAMSVATAEIATIVVPTGAEQSPAVQAVQGTVARLFEAEKRKPVARLFDAEKRKPVAVERRTVSAEAEPLPDTAAVSSSAMPRDHIAMLD